MAISFGGINTGLPPNLVEQLVQAERMPIKNVERRKSYTESRLKLVEDLEAKLREIPGALKELAGTRGFSDMKLDSGDPNIVQGVVDPEGVTTGSWNVEVIELAQKAAALSNGFPDKDSTEVGVGYFSFDTADGAREVYINGSNNTLEGAAAAINSAGINMQATVINDRKDPDYPYRLMVTGKDVGGDHQIQYPTLYFLDGDQDFYFDEEREAKNGRVKIDGFEMEVPANTIEDYIPGLSIELKQAAPGRTVNLSVKEDHEAVSGKVQVFVDALNGVLSFVQSQNKMTGDTDTRGTLGGDSMLRRVESDIRRLIQGRIVGTGGDISYLTQVGISFSRNGTLSFDQDKFNSVLVKKTDAVQGFLVGDGFATGFIPRVRNLVSTLVDGSFGPVANRRKGLQSQVKRANQRIEGMERRVELKEKRLRQKFAKLEEKMAGLKAQGGMIAAKFGGSGETGLNFGGGSFG